MAARLQLRVVRTVLDALETLIREAWPLLKIYAVPWLGWTLALIALDRLWAGHLGAAGAPEYVIILAFAPFGALIAVGILRWIMEPREAFAPFRVDRTLALVTALFAVLGLANHATGQAVLAWHMAHPGIMDAGAQAGSSTGLRVLWLAAALLPNWLATLVIHLLVMPQAAVAVERGTLDPGRQWQLVRLAPLAILGIAVLIGVCRLGFSMGYSEAVLRIVSWDGPLADLSSAWWRDLAVDLWRALILLPAHFLTDALALVALGRVYKALAGYADRQASAVVT